MLFESKINEISTGEVQNDFLTNHFKEPLLCKIETILYEFPSALTLAYLKKNEMNQDQPQFKIMLRI